MVKVGKGKFTKRGSTHPGYYVYLSIKVVKDSTFPFHLGDDLSVKIVGKKLIIEKH